MQTAAQIGYSESEFWDMTPRFFVAAMKGYEARQREAVDIARIMTYKIVSVNFDPKKRAPRLAEIWPTAWDMPSAVQFEEMTEEQYNALRERRKAKLEAMRSAKHLN